MIILKMEIPSLSLPLQPTLRRRDPFQLIDPCTEPERYELFDIIQHRLATEKLKRIEGERKRKADNDLYLEYIDEEKYYDMEE